MRRRGLDDKTVRDLVGHGDLLSEWILREKAAAGMEIRWNRTRDEGVLLMGGMRSKIGEEGGGMSYMRHVVFFLISYPVPSLPDIPLHPMSWVSVTFWTCQANMVEWLELSVKLMCSLLLKELGERNNWNSEEYIQILNIRLWDGKW